MAEFKASFIPKKPLTARAASGEGGGINLVLFVSLIIFFAVVLVAGGVFLYGVLLVRQEENLSASIERARQAIEPELVSSLGRIDARIKAAQYLLDNHIVLSPVFDLLEQMTLASVSFENFRYVVEPDEKIILRLSGVARNYSSIALQSVIFGESKFIKNPIFSNLQLDSKGNVTFSFSANIDRRLILYKNIVSSLGSGSF